MSLYYNFQCDLCNEIVLYLELANEITFWLTNALTLSDYAKMLTVFCSFSLAYLPKFAPFAFCSFFTSFCKKVSVSSISFSAKTWHYCIDWVRKLLIYCILHNLIWTNEDIHIYKLSIFDPERRKNCGPKHNFVLFYRCTVPGFVKCIPCRLKLSNSTNGSR